MTDDERMVLWRDRKNPASLNALLLSIEKAIYRLARRFAFLSGMDLDGLANDARARSVEIFDEFDPETARACLFPFVYQRMQWHLMGITKDQSTTVHLPRQNWAAGQRPKHAASISVPVLARRIARIVDHGPHPLDEIIKRDEVRVLRQALSQLDPRTAQILISRSEGRTCKQIGDEMSIGRERVRQLEVLGIQNLRQLLNVPESTRAMSMKRASETRVPTSRARATQSAP